MILLRLRRGPLQAIEEGELLLFLEVIGFAPSSARPTMSCPPTTLFQTAARQLTPLASWWVLQLRVERITFARVRDQPFMFTVMTDIIIFISAPLHIIGRPLRCMLCR
jgi:hypothetical protein